MRKGSHTYTHTHTYTYTHTRTHTHTHLMAAHDELQAIAVQKCFGHVRPCAQQESWKYRQFLNLPPHPHQGVFGSDQKRYLTLSRVNPAGWNYIYILNVTALILQGKKQYLCGVISKRYGNSNLNLNKAEYALCLASASPHQGQGRPCTAWRENNPRNVTMRACSVL